MANQALFPQAFEILCRYPEQEISYTKLLGQLYAIEVKSGRTKSASGLASFAQQFAQARPVILTPDNFPSLSEDPRKFLNTLGR